MPEMRSETCCPCAQEFQAIQVKSSEYSRIKGILNRGKHPTFIGRQLVLFNGRNGGAFVFRFGGEDLATAIVNPATNCLLVLNVLPAHRSHGLGAAIVRFLQCNFARVVESAVPWFERNGYVSRGALKQGRRLKTQVMVKSSLLTLAGRVTEIYGAQLRTTEKAGH